MKRGLPFALIIACGGDPSVRPSHVRGESNGVNGGSVKMLLPNWATPEEEAAARREAAPEVTNTPPPAGYRVPAEYEPVQAVTITWAGSSTMLSQIARATAAAGADVWAVGGPSTLAGVPSARYQSLDIDYDSIWARDYGPTGIDEVAHKLGIVDTVYRHYASRRADDRIPCALADRFGAGCYGTPLILDGGTFMSAGQGNAFLTKRVYEWNSNHTVDEVNGYLRSHFNATTIHILDYAGADQGYPADGTGHMDMFAKLLAPCKVMVAQTDDQPFKASTDKAAAYFASLACGAGTYEVYRTPGWDAGGTWYTYTNSLIVNQTVIMPAYDNADNDAAADVYRAALPGYTIVQVNSEDTIGMGGSIHCITKEIPAVSAQ